MIGVIRTTETYIRLLLNQILFWLRGGRHLVSQHIERDWVTQPSFQTSLVTHPPGIRFGLFLVRQRCLRFPSRKIMQYCPWNAGKTDLIPNFSKIFIALWIKSKGIWFYSREGEECSSVLWKAENMWASDLLVLNLYEGYVARLDSRILDHLFASRWEQETCKHFLFSVM